MLARDEMPTTRCQRLRSAEVMLILLFNVIFVFHFSRRSESADPDHEARIG